MRYSLLLLLAVLCGLVIPLLLLDGRVHAGSAVFRPDIMRVADVRPGMKGYGLTVFEGTRPERFEVEVIDVLKNFRPRQDLILIKTHHPRLEVAKVVAGMSGSPVFINDKMIGAYAYGWTFGREPVAGVTPIEDMLGELLRPLPDSIYGWPLRARRGPRPPPGRRTSAAANHRFRGAAGSYDIKLHAQQVASRRACSGPIQPVATPLLVGGMTHGAIETARTLLAPLGLEPLQAGGSGETEADAPTRYVNGSAIGVQLIRGDVSAVGLGTVTRVEGDRLIAFGHPMMQAGVTAIPTSISRVLWLLASEMRSFKIGMPVRPVGAMVNDRTASIVVNQAAKAPVIPVTMRLTGVPGPEPTTWEFELAHEKFMTPSFLAVALGSALQAVAAERQDISWTATSRLKLRGYPELVLEDYGVAIGGTPDAQEFVRSNLVEAVGALLNNPWEPIIVERADMEFELRYSRDVLHLRGAEVLEPEVEAGGEARIRLTLIPYAGPEVTRTLAVPIPRYLAGKDLKLTIKPGYLEERDKADPENVSELLQALKDPVYPPKSVVVTYDSGDEAVAYRGIVADNIPPGALDLITPTTSSVFPQPFRSTVRRVIPLPVFLVGSDTVQVSVKPVLR